MTAIRRLAIVVTALVLLAVPMWAQVPQIINYQGRITVGGAPFTGTGQFRFALVDGDGTTSYWSNDGTSTTGDAPAAAVALPVVDGLYAVPLGDPNVSGMARVPASVFANRDVRLRVWFDDGTNGSQPLSPEQRITSAGSAMVAATVPDEAITNEKLASRTVISGTLNGNAAPATNASNLTAQLATPGTIKWSQLENVPADFASGANDIGKLLKAGDTMSGAVNMDGNQIANFVSPSSDGNPVSLGYLNSSISALLSILSGQTSSLDASKVNRSEDTIFGSLVASGGVVGDIRLQDDVSSANFSNAGALGYNSMTSEVSYHNGVQWAPPGFHWEVVTGTTQQAVSGGEYVADSDRK